MVLVATVEQEGYKMLLKLIDPRYQLFSLKYFATDAQPEMKSTLRSDGAF